MLIPVAVAVVKVAGGFAGGFGSQRLGRAVNDALTKKSMGNAVDEWKAQYRRPSVEIVKK